MTAPAPCPRCGYPLEALPRLAGRAAALAGAVARLAAAHAGMRLAVPRAFIIALQQLKRDDPHLAEALACHVGLCCSPADAK